MWHGGTEHWVDGRRMLMGIEEALVSRTGFHLRVALRVEHSRTHGGLGEACVLRHVNIRYIQVAQQAEIQFSLCLQRMINAPYHWGE